MKKVGNKRFENFPAAKLYLDDLLELISILQESCEDVQIRTANYEEIKPSEIKELAASLGENRFGDIYIQSYRPHISLELRTLGISAYVSDDSLLQHGIISKFREVIEKRKIRYFNTFINLLWLPLIIGFGVSIAMSEWTLAGMLLGLTFIVIWPIVKFQMSHKIVVLTTLITNKQSFLSRKKDDITVALVTTFFSTILPFILIKCFGQ